MNLADVITRHARETPHAPAVIEGEKQVDYASLDRAIWRAAGALRKRGVAPGSIAGIAMQNGAAYLVVAYALARMGAVQMALPLREPGPVRERLTQRFGARTVIGDGDFDPAWLADDGGAIDESLRAPGGAAGWRIVMSSGTTAEPKAVLQSHATHCAWREIYARAIPGEASDRLLAVVELDFYAGLRQCMELHAAGAAVIFAPQAHTAGEVLDAIRRYAVNYVHLLPTNLHGLLAWLPQGSPPLNGIRVLRAGGMIASHKLRREVQQRLTPNLVITYGTNDFGWPLTYADRELLERHPHSIGIPPPGVRIEVVDEAGQPLPPGEPGVVRAQAPGLQPVSYIDNPRATAEAFRDGWYYPGDVGMLSDEGALYFKGRADDQMNFDGIKLYPADIEAALLDHPAVVESAAFPLRSARHQDVPAVAVVLRGTLQRGVLEAWCAERLGVRAPRVIVAVQALPRNPTGKVLKRELAYAVLKSLSKR